MALFKIAKGSVSNLSTSTISKKPIEGYCWFTTDDGRFYIDTSTSTNNAVIGTNRIAINGVHTASNSWTAGSSAGPTLSITINDITSTAAAIPSASATASGIVTTGDQDFNGTKGFGYMARYGRTNTGAATRWVADTWLYNDAGTQVGEFWYDCGDATNITTGQYVWSQYSPNSTANTSTTGKKENYKLPVVTSGLTENKNYTIITTKNPADLGYYLPLTGGTLSGDITIAKTGEPALIVNNTSDHKAGLIIGASSKNAGLWDYTNSKWIVYSTAAGAVTLNGNATTSSGLLYSAQKTTAADLNAFHTANQLSACLWNGWSDTDKASASYPGVTNGIILDGGYVNTNFGFQIAIDDDPTGFMALRQKNGNGWQAWKRIPMGDGTGASGSWGISITGNAATATKANGLVDGTSTMTSAYNKAGLNYGDYTWLAGWNGYELRAVNKSQFVRSGISITAPSTASSWLSGQNGAHAAYNVGDATDTGSYWPWLRQTNTSSAKWFSFGTLNTSFYWIGSATSRTANGYDYGMSFNIANGYLQGCSRVYGAVWNDYAEYRKNNPNENQEPGRCIKELGDGSLALTTKRLERGCEIVSDTFGFAIGQDEKNGYNTPIASNGRVLAYPYESIEEFASHIGWPVCSGPNGTVSIMTEEEEEKYPSRIIGTISEIPDYEEWGTGKVKVDGRIWIRIR